MLRNIVRRLSHGPKLNQFQNFSVCAHLCGNHKMQIGTHDGVFHCDEVFACYMLKCLPEFKDADIIRTRDMNKLKDCDIVVDVGAEFDHNKKRYDHHQREFNETLSTLRPDLGDKYKIKLSSAGLIYTYYGEQVIKQLCPKDQKLTSEGLKLVYEKLYQYLFEEIDAIDNGVPMTTDKPNYNIHTDLSSRIKRLNPDWNTSQTVNIDESFKKAMLVVGEELQYNINYFICTWLSGRDFVKAALTDRFEVHESGQILLFSERFPWKEHLFDLEKELGLNDEVKYVLFNDKPQSWRVQAVPITSSSFITRKPLNKAWWGVRDEVLSEIAGIEGCIFCHSTGFIGGNVTKEGALEMAVNSLNANHE